MQMLENTPDILKKIVTQKIIDISNDQAITSLEMVKNQALKLDNTSDFYNNLKAKADRCENTVIAEIKKASPSKGILRTNFNVVEIATEYEQCGASCLSILTDREFFQGSDAFVKQVAQVTKLPILRKEFIIDEYQMYQAKAMGASCILLIAAILTTTFSHGQ